MTDKFDGVPLVLPYAANLELPGVVIVRPEELLTDSNGDPARDGMSYADIKSYLYGLIHRDCEAPSKEYLERYYATPEGQEAKRKGEERAAAFKSGDLRMVSLRESREDGFSLKYVEVDRAALRRLMDDGWRFDADFEAWAKEGM